MNQRQKIKRLKKDNELMHKIINNTAEMKRLYTAYNEPVKNIVTSHVNIKKYETRRCMPYDWMDMPFDEMCTILKQDIAAEIADIVKKQIEYRIDDNHNEPIMSGSVYIGSI